MQLILVFLLTFNIAHASLPELFGSSAGSMAIGNQAEKESAANNHYAGALLGYAKATQFSFNTFYIDTQFSPVKNVVTKNETNSVNVFENKDVEVNPTPTLLFGAHLSTPLFAPEGPKLNLSIFAPFDRLMEADTGDPYQPRYAMYENRFIRPNLSFSVAQAFDKWAAALGTITGIQSGGETFIVTRTTNGNPSLGKVSYNAKPSVGATASVSYKTEKTLSYFAFQQEMKSRMEMRGTGETEIASNASFPFDFKIRSLLYYDPMTFRLGTQYFQNTTNYFLSVEYQKWSSYESSTLKLKKQGGTINGSQDLENLKLTDIIIPRIGLDKKIGERWSLKGGYFYRPTPIKTKALKHAGNTIDTDKHVGSIGTGTHFLLYGKTINVDLAYQAHFLKNQKIIKTANREDGDPSQPKIGSPGYRIGGMIHVLSAGISWMY